jgi:hypothetical protein
MNLLQRELLFDEDPFSISYLRENRWLQITLVILMAAAGGWLIGKYGSMGIIMTVGLPVGLLVLMAVFREPKIGLLIYIHISFLIGWTRFLTVELPLGLALDGMLILTLLSVFLNGKRMNWKRLRHPIVFLLGFWFLYNVVELLNPEAPYKPAWFFHARFYSLNWSYIAIIMLVMPVTREDIKHLIKVWAVWSFLACLWAFKQQYINLEDAEIRWLETGAAKTHVLFGQLRSFSFYSDASQFGAEMAGLSLICVIWMFAARRLSYKIGYFALALMFFWGYAVSGTRSALFVLLGGYVAYLGLMRKPWPIIRGLGVLLPLMAILWFTSIGDSNYQIYRIRTALHPSDDPSFLLRLENQEKLRNYLKNLPFGAGIGTATDTGNRFSPNHFAAQVAPDSWYVQLWLETGVVGLTLYLLMLAGIVGVGVYKLWQINDPWLFKIMIALLAEFIGIACMSYSNPTLGQFPTSTILYITSILFMTSERWDTPKPKPALTPTPASRFVFRPN